MAFTALLQCKRGMQNGLDIVAVKGGCVAGLTTLEIVSLNREWQEGNYKGGQKNSRPSIFWKDRPENGISPPHHRMQFHVRRWSARSDSSRNGVQ
jgi:hypothetical protein